MEKSSLTGLLGVSHRQMRERKESDQQDDLTALIDKGDYFTSLPRDYYVSHDLFEEEVRKVFFRQWVYAGQASQLRNPGDYLVRDIGPESIILALDDQGRHRAFFNSCRHRGSRLCPPGAKGNSKIFVCPYHQWTFKIDGSLRNAPGMKNGIDFDFSKFGLHEAKCGTYHGSLFVYLADEEPEEQLKAFLEARTADTGKLAAIDGARTKVAHRKVYEVNANWKTLMENNMECYHCPATHPTLCAAIDVRATYLSEDGEVSTIATNGLFPFMDGMKTMTASGEWACKKPLGEFQGEQFSAGYIVYPSFCGVSYFSDYGVAIVVEPVTLDKSRLIAEWIVHEDAVEGEDYEIENLIRAWDNTNLEDLALSEGNYLGTTSRRYIPGPNNIRREGMIRLALVRYLEMMAKA